MAQHLGGDNSRWGGAESRGVVGGEPGVAGPPALRRGGDRFQASENFTEFLRMRKNSTDLHRVGNRCDSCLTSRMCGSRVIPRIVPCAICWEPDYYLVPIGAGCLRRWLSRPKFRMAHSNSKNAFLHASKLQTGIPRVAEGLRIGLAISWRNGDYDGIV